MREYGENYGDVVPAWWQAPPPQPAAPRRRGSRWLVIGALALAFALALGVGAAVGSSLLGTAQAASLSGGGTAFSQTLAAGPGTRGRAGQAGQCGTLTVSSVSGQTIAAKAADGSTVTIHTTASTQYTKGGQSATASAVTAGAQIHVDGTHNSDGSITATRIDVG